MNGRSDILHHLALYKQRYTRGTSWTQILLSFGIITANAKLFEDFFSIHLGLTLPMVIVIAIPLYVTICYVIGRIDESTGFWQAENDLGYRFTPISQELIETVREINQKLG